MLPDSTAQTYNSHQFEKAKGNSEIVGALLQHVVSLEHNGIRHEKLRWMIETRIILKEDIHIEMADFYIA